MEETIDRDPRRRFKGGTGYWCRRLFGAYSCFWEMFDYIHEKTFGFADWFVHNNVPRLSDAHLYIYMGPVTQETVEDIIVPYLKTWDAERVYTIEHVEGMDVFVLTISLKTPEARYICRGGK